MRLLAVCFFVCRSGFALEGAPAGNGLKMQIETLRLYDEILTQSLRNYGYSLDDKWLKWYEDYKPELDGLIEALRTRYATSDLAVLERFERANNTLYALEEQIMKLIQSGKSAEAVAIIEGELYSTNKIIYGECLDRSLGLEHAPRSSLVLTPEERTWLAEHPEIRLGFNPDMEPLLIQRDDGVLEGVYPEIVAELEKLIGIRIQIEIGDWMPIVQQARSRKLDGLLVCSPSQAKASKLLSTHSANILSGSTVSQW